MQSVFAPLHNGGFFWRCLKQKRAIITVVNNFPLAET